MFLGLYTKKEVNKEKLKSYQNGYDDGNLFERYLLGSIDMKKSYIYNLEKENIELKRKIKEVRQIEAIKNRTKKYRVKKKCEARLQKIRLGR